MKWSMRRKPRRPLNPWRVMVLLLLIAFGVYLNQVVVPTLPSPFVPTPTPTPNPEAVMNEARRLFAQGKLARAIETYQGAILADPRNPALFIELARVQMLSGAVEASLTSAQNALLLNPNNPQALTWQAWALHRLGRTEEALVAVRQALEADPNLGLAHAVYAEILADQGNYTRADEEIRTALDLAPNSMEVHAVYGYVLYVESYLERAAKEYQQAIAGNKYIPEWHLQLGLIYRLLGQRQGDPALLDQAIEEFLTANTLDPPNPLPDTYIARTYAALGEFGKALQYAADAVQEAPTDPYMHGNYGVMLYKNGKYAEAVRELALVVHGGLTADGVTVEGLPLDYGRVAEYYFTYGWALLRLRRCDEAVPIFQAILNTIPADQISVENAQAGLKTCRELALTPQPNLTGTPEGTPAPGETTPTPTPTPQP